MTAHDNVDDDGVLDTLFGGDDLTSLNTPWNIDDERKALRRIAGTFYNMQLEDKGTPPLVERIRSEFAAACQNVDRLKGLACKYYRQYMLYQIAVSFRCVFVRLCVL